MNKPSKSKDLHLQYLFTDRGGDLVYQIYHMDDAKTRSETFGRVRLCPTALFHNTDQSVEVEREKTNGSK